ncbi:phosphatidylinositol-bisphosphatase [Exophiala viscosa]|uniref:phosphatidylinositol-bisphosphatase n=1 Tax=Exophiala viscosa TaxID=2486360 RepID=UPI00219325D5|nr:phosphatidylinositol-bisphosphatase [Exophiala viscosa]
MSLGLGDKGEKSQISPKPWHSTNPWGAKVRPPGALYLPPAAHASHAAQISAPQSLSAAVRARKNEYIRKKTIKIKVGTWNVASISGTEKDLGAWFIGGLGVKGLSQDLAGLGFDDDDGDDSDSERNIESVEAQEARFAKKKTTMPKDDVPAEPSGEQVDLYVLGLQEVVDVSSMTEAIKPYTDPNPGKKWKRSLKRALPPGYIKVAEEQLLGLLILIYASPELAPTISSVSTTSVGTGLMGYLGNKGAVSARIMLGETTKLCFINCHLAAGADPTALIRRIWDTTQILNKTRFAPVSPDGEVAEITEEKIGDEDFAFWFGDLNYRLDDIPGEDVRRLLLLHTRNEYDIENRSKRRIDSELGYVDPHPSDTVHPQQTHYEYKDAERPAIHSEAEPALDPRSDPASLLTTIQSLLAHDQLRNQQRMHKIFHEGWREGEITFLPTYKYDVGSVGMFDSGEKKRSPSWCDRILYRTRRDKEMYEEKMRQLTDSRKKDASMKARGIDEATAEHDVLFDYDPETDGLAYGDDYDEYDDQQDACHDAELVKTHEDYGDTIEINNYISHQRVLSSDHKPLNAVFTLTYDAVVPELKAKVHQHVARGLDKAENENRPTVTVVVDHHADERIPNADGPADMNAVLFGEIRYAVKKTRLITIANTGQIAASFSFVERPAEPGQEAGVAPRWLQLMTDPHEVQTTTVKAPMELSPGESCSIGLSVDIADGELVSELNEGRARLEDILVLRLENGRDHFIPVKGIWLQSAFYRNLDQLVLAPEGGVRNMHVEDLANESGQASMSHHSAPKELYALTEVIPVYVVRSIAEWSMIHDEDIPPWQYATVGITWPFTRDTWTLHEDDERSDLLASIREALDTASPLDTHFEAEASCIVRLETLAETLTEFLRSLRDGIVSASSWAEVERSLSAMEKGKVQPSSQEIQDMVMEALSPYPVHSVSFTFITFLLTRIVNELAPCGAPASTPGELPPASPNPSRRSRTSTMSTDSEQAPSIYSQVVSPQKKSFFPAFRGRRTQSVSASSMDGTDAEPAHAERRKQLISAYADIFAPIVIRSQSDATVKGKDKRALESRKKRVLEAFLQTR